MSTNKSPVEARLETFDIYASYRKAKYLSVKHSSYFQVYEELLSRYRNTKCTFVEVGVLNGGSLFMWRDYLGPEARIIGIDLNPLAKQWESAGFEIHVGDQGDPRFWDHFFASVGDVDVILDDGGHTNVQQIVTAEHCVPHIRNQGMLIVEDTHTSYLKLFGNPSRYSFINYAKRMIDRINSRFPDLHSSDSGWEKAVYSMRVYESIVCFHIDRERCFVSSPTWNGGITFNAVGFSHRGTQLEKIDRLRSRLRKRFGFLRKSRLIRGFYDSLFSVHARLNSRKLKKYF
jgi:methyltransferase family protein